MHVVVDVILTVAIVSLAAGAIAKLQIGIVGVGPAADGAFVMIGLGARGRGVARSPVGVGLLLFGRLAEAELLHRRAVYRRQHVADVLAEKQEIVQQRHQHQQRIVQPHREAAQHGKAHHVQRQHGEIEPGEVFHLQRDDHEQIHPVFRHDSGKGQQQAEVQIIGRSADPRGQRGDVGEDNPRQIVDGKAQRPPLPLQHPADEIVEKQLDGQQQQIAGVGDKDIGEQAPHLSVEDFGRVPAQKAINHVAGVDIAEQIDNGVANGDKQHQVGDAPAAVLIAEPLKAAAQCGLHSRTPFSGVNLGLSYPIAAGKSSRRV